MTDPWPLEKRRQMMRDVIAEIARCGALEKVDPAEVAKTYDSKGHILPAEVEAEMMRHLSEGSDGK